MERIDPRKARQVWQRVSAPPTLGTEQEALHQLLLSAAETAALYQALAGLLTGNPKEQARQLWEGQQETVFCLRGLLRLGKFSGDGVRSPKLPAMPAGKLLAQCYRRAKEALAEYAARSIDSEFGPVFRSLAQREERNCALIAGILGQI